jgi:hypothetical protein
VKLLAQQPDRDFFVIIPERDPLMPSFAQDKLIRKSLANQKCVIVKTRLEGPEHFSEQDIGAEMGPLGQICQWHGQ